MISRLGLAALMIGSGVLHFVVPEPYVRIIPKVLPDGWGRPLVYLSGMAELAGGIALLPARSRRGAGWFVVALLIVLFPANVQMALNSPNPLTVLRLPLQAPLIWLAWRQTR